mmetsp:Transcript_98532/g.180673  ORF Transcript_98532/g.180673 Transcript_98532/m.180673 type:complete len:456 (+) Transcript_98532:66-1433(+)
MADKSLTSKCIAEFVGTFLLVFTIGCNVLSKQTVWAPVSIACSLMVGIYAFGGISGANFNPAVSFSLGIVKSLGGQGGLDWMTVGIYSVVQILAGILAGFTYEELFFDQFFLKPGKGFNFANAGTCEFFYTFMLCFVVLNVAAVKKSAPNQWYGLAIGFVIIAGAYGAGAVSGGCFNPAVALGIDISSAWMGLLYGPVYVPFQLLGATLAAFLFKAVRPSEFKDDVDSISLKSKLYSEFIGTFMLVFTVGLNVLGKSPAGAFSIAASLMCMVYALGDVSGAHFNPAVTVAILCNGAIEKAKVLESCYYILVQLLAGILAAYSYAFVYHAESFRLEPQGKNTMVQVAAAETMFTFVLCVVVLCTAVNEKTKSKDFFGLAIGSCITVGGFAIGGISGGSLNPAVSWGIAFASLLGGPGAFFLNALWYSCFETVGGVAAALLLKVTHMEVDAKKIETP